MIKQSTKTDDDLEQLRAAWSQATPEARRIFAEVHFADDGWPAAEGIRECDVLGLKWSRK
jgi:hypothetical protein